MQENTDFFYKILPNGLKIVHKKADSAVAYVGIMVGAGTRDEQPEENGMAHYIEHCVFKGTAHHTARQLLCRIEGIGGEINAYTTKEETTFYAAVPVEHWHKAAHTLIEMVTEPTFPKKETDKEVNVILDEIESYNDSPSELIYDDFESLLFAGENLSRPILGTRKTLRHICSKPHFALDWIEAHYRPEHMVLFSTGNIEFESVCHMWEKMQMNGKREMGTGKWERGTGNWEEGNGKREMQMQKRTHQVHVMLGGKAYPIGHEKQLALYLLNNILGGGALNSRLNLSLREKHGLVYTVDANYTPLSDTGYWSVYFACDKEDKDECIRLVNKELELLREHRLTDTQLRLAKHQIHGQMAIAAENRENAALTMAKQMLYHNRAFRWEETFDRINRITAEELQAVAREVFAPEQQYRLEYL